MIIVIAGATATGKTEIAIKLAQDFNGYIINADSRQVFKELNIGTAKPTPEEIKQSKVQHELFGHISINEDYNLYRYQKEVQEILEKTKSKIAFLVGGTGLYIDSVVYNYRLQEQKKNKLKREELEKLSLEDLQEKVGEDLENLNESDRKNPRRLIRFLERGGINYERGKPLEHIYLVIQKDFDVLEENIKKRIEKMFKEGLVEENEGLFKKKIKTNTIGYKEFEDYFKGEIDLEEVKERIFLNTRQYAKRQITWFRKNKNAIWVKDYGSIPSIIIEGIA